MAELERHISVWNECLRIFEQNVEPKQFDVWFKTIVPVSLEGSTLTVEVPTEFFRSYLEDALQDPSCTEGTRDGIHRVARQRTGEQAGDDQHVPAIGQSESVRLSGDPETQDQPEAEPGLLL